MKESQVRQKTENCKTPPTFATLQRTDRGRKTGTFIDFDQKNPDTRSNIAGAPHLWIFIPFLNVRMLGGIILVINTEKLPTKI